MCGLFGVCGDVTHKEELIFKSGLIFNSVRGMDSTGAGSVSRNLSNGYRDMQIAKEIGAFAYLFDTERFKKLFHGVNSVYIGHNRSKTVGDASRKNAHPFLFEDIMGAHNGTLDYQNKNRLEAGNSFSTDSEAIFNNIQVHGIEDTISRIDESEAYALTWYDRRDNSMNFIRNKHRPLIFCTVNKGRTLFWSSELGILRLALYRAGIEEDDKFYEFPENWHYKYILPKEISSALPKPNIKLLKQRIPWSYQYNKKNTSGKSQGREWEGDGYDTRFGYAYAYGTDDSDGDVSESVVSAVKSESSSEDTNNTSKLLQAAKATFTGAATEAIRKSRDLLDKLPVDKRGQTTTVKSQSGTHVMSPDDVIRQRAWDTAQSAGLIPSEGTEAWLIYPDKNNPDKNLRVYRSIQDGYWITLKYNNLGAKIDRFDTKKPPSDLKCKIVDINARHEFRHEGKGKHKKIYYRGFHGDKLTQDMFNKHMEKGCLSCERHPEWGNTVVFINKAHEFLCEYCSLDESLKKELIRIGNEDSKKAA